MEVLIHEASNRQEISASAPTCTVDLKSASKAKREDVDEASEITRKNDKKSIDIIFENITYTVNLGFRKGHKEILHGINGRLPGKQLIALMGPSGAGKSTLLDILSGFRVTGVEGVVLINGRLRHLNSFRKCSAYITQDDRVEPLLTVVENMRVSADLKLPSNTSRHEKEMIRSGQFLLHASRKLTEDTGATRENNNLHYSSAQCVLISTVRSIIELACGEYGEDKLDMLINGSQNGSNLQWFENSADLMDAKSLRAARPLLNKFDDNSGLHATNLAHQIRILLRRGFIMCKRDTTLTHLRIAVNIIVGIMLGSVFLRSGADGSRVLDNYNLLFSILIHHMMTTMMLTIVTFPMQMSILVKEHFNRWYSLKAFYTAITLIDVPISIICCIIFSLIVYFMSAQPLELIRFFMFLAISMLVAFIGQGTGLMIGAVFNVVNGTFMGPTLAVPLMMFAGFGVSLRDLPNYLKWGSYISYLRYGLEGFVGAIYGFDRPILDCKEKGELYCHYRYPSKFLSDIAMRGDQFWNDIIALTMILIITRCGAYLFLRWKIVSYR
ncbi:atp-binding cassette sub-family g member 4 [Lasius niger]|uniref:Atp-binding cassette sub-family g member 4 n=1 Tax=Lasius niger TaxID=67767 RepID=A0A0J7KRH6_LASNI|nr:atp-binding cassette sub-family g member 4 [Lasius niger]